MALVGEFDEKPVPSGERSLTDENATLEIFEVRGIGAGRHGFPFYV